MEQFKSDLEGSLIKEASFANEEFKEKAIYSKIVSPTPAPAPQVKPPVVIKPPSPSPPSTGAPLPPVRSRADCEPLCAERCKKHSRKQVCERACVTCCDRCKCVPPGTYGSRERCGKCYTKMEKLKFKHY